MTRKNLLVTINVRPQYNREKNGIFKIVRSSGGDCGDCGCRCGVFRGEKQKAIRNKR